MWLLGEEHRAGSSSDKHITHFGFYLTWLPVTNALRVSYVCETKFRVNQNNLVRVPQTFI